MKNTEEIFQQFLSEQNWDNNKIEKMEYVRTLNDVIVNFDLKRTGLKKIFRKILENDQAEKLMADRKELLLKIRDVIQDVESFSDQDFQFEEKEKMPKYVFVSPRNTYVKDAGVIFFGSSINADVCVGDMVSIIDGAGKDIKAEIESIEQEGKLVNTGKKGIDMGIVLKGVKSSKIHADNVIICE
jgi:transcription antitermination factor NusG